MFRVRSEAQIRVTHLARHFEQGRINISLSLLRSQTANSRAVLVFSIRIERTHRHLRPSLTKDNVT